MTDAIIDFKDFSFRYESQAHPTLKKINLQIYPGEKMVARDVKVFVRGKHI